MRQIDPGLYAWGNFRTAREYSNLEREIEYLRTLDLSATDDRTLRRALHAVGRGYATRTIHLSPGRTFTTFRTSRPTSLENPWNHIKDLWAPPAAIVGRGRFNENRKPVLYVSSDPHTALMEAQPKPYEVRVILLLKKRAVAQVMHFVQIGLEHFPDFYAAQDNFRDVRGGIRAEPKLKSLLQERGIYDYWERQDSYLSELCTKQYGAEESEHAYRLTFEVASQLQKIRHVSGIQYPTVANDYRGLNLAIPVKAAREHFVPVQAWLLQLGANIDQPGRSDRPGRRYDGDVIRIGSFAPSGALLWGPEGRWSTDDLHWQMAPPPNVRRP